MLTTETEKLSCAEMFKRSCVIVRAMCGGQVRTGGTIKVNVCLILDYNYMTGRYIR